MAELAKAIVVTSGAEDFVSITMSEITMKVTTPMMGQPTKEGS
jgi:hydroxyethylthiazole kinase-like sugar kinase family protein